MKNLQTTGMRSDYTKGNQLTTIKQNQKNSLGDSRQKLNSFLINKHFSNQNA